MSGLIYLLAAIALNARFLYFVFKLHREERHAAAAADATFRFSITYLMLLVRGAHRRSLPAVRRLTGGGLVKVRRVRTSPAPAARGS